MMFKHFLTNFVFIGLVTSSVPCLGMDWFEQNEQAFADADADNPWINPGGPILNEVDIDADVLDLDEGMDGIIAGAPPGIDAEIEAHAERAQGCFSRLYSKLANNSKLAKMRIIFITLPGEVLDTIGDRLYGFLQKNKRTGTIISATAAVATLAIGAMHDENALVQMDSGTFGEILNNTLLQLTSTHKVALFIGMYVLTTSIKDPLIAIFIGPMCKKALQVAYYGITASSKGDRILGGTLAGISLALLSSQPIAAILIQAGTGNIFAVAGLLGASLIALKPEIQLVSPVITEMIARGCLGITAIVFLDLGCNYSHRHIQDSQQDHLDNRIKLAFELPRDNKTCNICSDDYVTGDKVRILKPCDHSFHTACMQGWLAHNPDLRCPLCRSRLQATNNRRPWNNVVYVDCDDTVMQLYRVIIDKIRQDQ